MNATESHLNALREPPYEFIEIVHDLELVRDIRGVHGFVALHAARQLDECLGDGELVRNWCTWLDGLRAVKETANRSSETAQLTPVESPRKCFEMLHEQDAEAALDSGELAPRDLRLVVLDPNAMRQIATLRSAAVGFQSSICEAPRNCRERPDSGWMRGVVRKITAFQAITLTGVAASLLFSLLAYSSNRQTVPQSNEVPATRTWNTMNGGDSDKLPDVARVGTGWRHGLLAVGVSEYRHSEISPLVTPEAQAFAAANWGRERFLADTSNIITLTNNAATETGVRSALVYFKQMNKALDTLVIYLACHAIRDDTGELSLLLYDSEPGRGIRARELLDLLGDTEANVLVVANVCFAGSLFDVQSQVPRLWVVMSAESNRKALDPVGSASAGVNQSPFSGPWFEALNGEADRDRDDVVTLKEAFDYTNDSMLQAKAAHVPSLRSVAGADPGAFALSFHPKFHNQLVPNRSQPVPEPAVLTLKILDPPSELDTYSVTLDGIALGEIRAPSMVLRVAPGDHEIDVSRKTVLRVAEGSHDVTVSRLVPRWAGVEGAEATCPYKFTAQAGKQISQSLRLQPRGRLNYVRVLDQTGTPDGGRFMGRVPSPATDAVQVSVTDGVIRFEFLPQGTLGPMSVSFVPDGTPGGTNGVNVASLFGLRPDQTVTLSFEARADRDTDVTFFCGGIADDSLTPAQTLSERLSADAWRTYRMTVSAGRVTRLIGGFGVQVDPAPEGGRPIVLYVREVKLQPESSSP